eukprot:CAMPEP_0204258902 /NCGR_PEP_ID=MMETSP0468-20130131/5225_1 /ASSEMBLY_ACC=CAM_ASM_000383 /TAXON_ID=2969 /ORGANISM="Oxyrrhis marina" /LENGTH=270 /DNA_ID=CAMNT_0051233107 /DNA_START=51 /DNA_END=863 /DNA_ORIENTATION=-
MNPLVHSRHHPRGAHKFDDAGNGNRHDMAACIFGGGRGRGVDNMGVVSRKSDAQPEGVFTYDRSAPTMEANPAKITGAAAQVSVDDARELGRQNKARTQVGQAPFDTSEDSSRFSRAGQEAPDAVARIALAEAENTRNKQRYQPAPWSTHDNCGALLADAENRRPRNCAANNMQTQQDVEAAAAAKMYKQRAMIRENPIVGGYEEHLHAEKPKKGGWREPMMRESVLRMMQLGEKPSKASVERHAYHNSRVQAGYNAVRNKGTIDLAFSH